MGGGSSIAKFEKVGEPVSVDHVTVQTALSIHLQAGLFAAKSCTPISAQDDQLLKEIAVRGQQPQLPQRRALLYCGHKIGMTMAATGSTTGGAPMGAAPVPDMGEAAGQGSVTDNYECFFAPTFCYSSSCAQMDKSIAPMIESLIVATPITFAPSTQALPFGSPVTDAELLEDLGLDIVMTMVKSRVKDGWRPVANLMGAASGGAALMKTVFQKCSLFATYNEVQILGFNLVTQYSGPKQTTHNPFDMTRALNTQGEQGWEMAGLIAVPNASQQTTEMTAGCSTDQPFLAMMIRNHKAESVHAPVKYMMITQTLDVDVGLKITVNSDIVTKTAEVAGQSGWGLVAIVQLPVEFSGANKNTMKLPVQLYFASKYAGLSVQYSALPAETAAAVASVPVES